MPQAYWIIPLEGGGGQIDNTLPGGLLGISAIGRLALGAAWSSRQWAAWSWGGPADPGWGWRPGHPAIVRRRADPGGERPDNELPEG